MKFRFRICQFPTKPYIFRGKLISYVLHTYVKTPYIFHGIHI